MADQRNISIEVPSALLAQINQRAVIHGRSRNAEFRYLIDYALDRCGENEIQIMIDQAEVTKSTARISYSVEAVILRRCEVFHRPLGTEIIRLVAYALQLSVEADLKIIAEMMSHQGLAAGGIPQPALP